MSIPAQQSESLVSELQSVLAKIIAETNGIALRSTLDLLQQSPVDAFSSDAHRAIDEFSKLLTAFQIRHVPIEQVLEHPFAEALFNYFHDFGLHFQEHHTHLTGALDESFVFPRLQEALAGPHGAQIAEQIREVYGIDASTLKTPEDISALIRLRDDESDQPFVQYLRKMLLTKVVLTTKQAHHDAAYHMAERLWNEANVGFIRLKWSFSRANSTGAAEEIPGMEHLSSEDITVALYEGFRDFQSKHPGFSFELAPSFRKELDYFDTSRFQDKQEDINNQVNEILAIIDRHPELAAVMTSVDTVGNEMHFYSKENYMAFKAAFRKLQFRGFKIRSHHGETWYTLRRGIQSVDNALNIWSIDAVEHGVALGINPNYYFHRLFQEALEYNVQQKPIAEGTSLWRELSDMDWRSDGHVLTKLLQGDLLSDEDRTAFIKTKFHTSREVERYQHDILNRMIDTGVELVSLPSSNYKLTTQFGDYKEHPFSWWEKKGMELSIGTDNYVLLNSNIIREMLILLFTDPEGLKLTKLLMVATGEHRRPYMSSVLWDMRRDKGI